MSPQAKASVHGAKRVVRETALLLRMDEVAVLLGVSVRTVWNLVRAELRAVRPPGLDRSGWLAKKWMLSSCGGGNRVGPPDEADLGTAPVEARQLARGPRPAK